MSVEIRHEGFKEVVGDQVELERLGTGFLFTEGPVWHPRDHYLIFSDMPGNCMRRWSVQNGVEVFRKPSNKANGNAYDIQGRLVTCEHATSRVTRTNPDGSIEALASHYNGVELNSPNDITVRSDGSIYFTDPVFGRRDFFGVAREQELSFQGVYQIRPDGELRLLTDDFEQPNGLSFSVDESQLYINDTPRMHIRVFDVGADGSLTGGKVWATVEGAGEGVADGLKVDGKGNVYCTGPGGIHVFDPYGVCLGVIRIPEKTANFTWGDEDFRSLYVTASTSLYRLRVKAPGRPAL
jgi:gluconolactonase